MRFSTRIIALLDTVPIQTLDVDHEPGVILLLDNQGRKRQLVALPGGRGPWASLLNCDSCLQADWRRPMTLPSVSFTEAISLPPPTSLTTCSASAPASRSSLRRSSMSSTCQ